MWQILRLGECLTLAAAAVQTECAPLLQRLLQLGSSELQAAPLLQAGLAVKFH